MLLSRRDLIKAVGSTSILGITHMTLPNFNILPASPHAGTRRHYGGANLTGWEVVLGDALYNCSTEQPVTLSDITTDHQTGYSELHANTVPRSIMAHNISFLRIIDPNALQYVHICGYKFKIPFIPTQDANAPLNAQTFEGGIFIWDGPQTRLDYGMAFQWILNPWGGFDPQSKQGEMRVWTGTSWLPVGSLVLDSARWYEIKMVFDPYRQTTALLFDNIHFATQFSKTAKPVDWGTEVAARLQAEIISIDPRPGCTIKTSHKAQIKDWYWEWEYPYQTLLPMTQKAICIDSNKNPSSCSEAFITSPCENQNKRSVSSVTRQDI